MKYFIYIFLLFTPFTTFANTTHGKLEGFIIDIQSGADLEFAEIIVYQNSEFVAGTSSQADGYFKVNLLPGNYAIKANYIGYESSDEIEVVVSKNMTTVVDIRLKQGLILPLVVITSMKNERCGVGCICYSTVLYSEAFPVIEEDKRKKSIIETAQKIITFPNPTTGVFYAEINEKDNLSEFTIIDSQGKTVSSTSNVYNTQFDISHLTDGTYYLIYQALAGNNLTVPIIKIE